MKRSLLAAAVVAGLVDASPARAQFVVGPAGPPPFAGGFGFGRGVGFSYHKKGLHVAGFAGGHFSRSLFFAPIGPPIPFGFGWGPPPVTVVVNPRVIVAPPFALDPDPDERPNGALLPNPNPFPVNPAPKPVPKPAPEPPVGRDGFVVIAPRRDFPPPGGVVPAAERVEAVPPRPVFRFDPFAPPIEVKAEKPDADPVREAIRLMRSGREAFAAAEYGTAGQRFARATAANPKAAEPHFLKAQAAFAAGGYADAVASIRAGLALDPLWPLGAFDPKEPYGANFAAFADHMADLRKTIAANPGDASLEFLLGYQLWFTGERAEAKKWFAAAKRLADPAVVKLFE